jgi:3-oxoacyl-(acyl-carrier-protein) synthase
VRRLSTNAIIDAFQLYWVGRADAMVTGGSEAAATIAGMVDLMPCMLYQQK